MIVLVLLQVVLALVCFPGLPEAPRVKQMLPPAEHSRAERALRPSRVVELLRERIRERPEEERVRLEQHLEEFEKLSPQSREKLLRRARVLRERERVLEAAEVPEVAPPQDGGKVRQEQRGRHLREKMRQLGSEMRSRLPRDLEQRLERAPPEQRRRLLERLWQDRERFSYKAIEKMRLRHDLAPREIQRLERLPLQQRLEALGELEQGRRGRRRQ